MRPLGLQAQSIHCLGICNGTLARVTKFLTKQERSVIHLIYHIPHVHPQFPRRASRTLARVSPHNPRNKLVHPKPTINKPSDRLEHPEPQRGSGAPRSYHATAHSYLTPQRVKRYEQDMFRKHLAVFGMPALLDPIASGSRSPLSYAKEYALLYRTTSTLLPSLKNTPHDATCCTPESLSHGQTAQNLRTYISLKPTFATYKLKPACFADRWSAKSTPYIQSATSCGMSYPQVADLNPSLTVGEAIAGFLPHAFRVYPYALPRVAPRAWNHGVSVR